jgi:anti-repressor protein
MSALAPFDYCGSNVRVVVRHGEPWFVARDVALVLGYSNPQKAVRDHCKGNCAVGVNDSCTLDPQTIIIPERDIYRLVMRSKLPAAARFEEWVVAEVLPQIRRTGAFQQTPSIPENYPEALRLAADLAEENTHLRLVVQEQKPQVDALQRIASSVGTMCMTDAAKHLGIARHKLIAWMRENRWIYRRDGSARWVAYQPRQQAGLLDHKVTVIGTEENGDHRLASQVRVTPKGLTVLAEQLGVSL